VFAVQIAKAVGAYVAATAGPRNQDFLRELGADLTIDYSREKLKTKFPATSGLGRSREERLAQLAARAQARRQIGNAYCSHSAQTGSKVRFFSTVIAGVAPASARALLGGKRLLITRIAPRGGELEKINVLIEAGKIRPVVEKSVSTGANC